MSQAGNGRGTKGVRQDRIRDMEQEARLWVLARFGSAELRRMNDLSGLSKRPGAYGLAFTPSPDADHLYARIYRPWSDGRFLYYGKGVHGGLLGRVSWHARGLREVGFDLADLSYATLPTRWASFAAFAEGVLLEAHGPTPWNHIVRGFGNRNPGFHRGSQQVARWDLLHVGRRHHSQRSMDFGAGGALAALDLARSALSADLASDEPVAPIVRIQPGVSEGRKPRL